MTAYKPDRRGLRELGKSPEMSRVCVEAAERGMEWAKRLPVEGPPDRLAEYRAGFRVEASPVTVAGEQRAGALLINDSDVERIFGGRNKTLARAVAQIEGATIR